MGVGCVQGLPRSLGYDRSELRHKIRLERPDSDDEAALVSNTWIGVAPAILVDRAS